MGRINRILTLVTYACLSTTTLLDYPPTILINRYVSPIKQFIGFEETIVVLVIAVIFCGKDLPVIFRKLAKLYMKAKISFQRLRDEVVSQIEVDEVNEVTHNKKQEEAKNPDKN